MHGEISSFSCSFSEFSFREHEWNYFIISRVVFTLISVDVKPPWYFFFLSIKSSTFMQTISVVSIHQHGRCPRPRTVQWKAKYQLSHYWFKNWQTQFHLSNLFSASESILCSQHFPACRRHRLLRFNNTYSKFCQPLHAFITGDLSAIGPFGFESFKLMDQTIQLCGWLLYRFWWKILKPLLGVCWFPVTFPTKFNPISWRDGAETSAAFKFAFFKCIASLLVLNLTPVHSDWSFVFSRWEATTLYDIVLSIIQLTTDLHSKETNTNSRDDDKHDSGCFTYK